jgi:hypothetical protein
MKTRHGLGVGLVGLLLSTVAFAAAPVAPDTTAKADVAARSAVMDEIVVKARHPNAEPKTAELTMQNPLDLLLDTPIYAPELADALLIKPEIRLSL